MSKKVTIIDYGIGNLFSVSRAFEHIGAQVIVTSEVGEIQNADYLVLPGVGAFSKGISELQKRNLTKPIIEFVATGKPFFGICLGMQLLFETSEENGDHQGLGIIKGRVKKIPDVSSHGEKIKVPHIGWTSLVKTHSSPLLDTINDKDSFYFVHSYYGICENEKNMVAYAEYGGYKLTACLQKDNVYGCQFHPEKSAASGLKLCSNFLKN